VTGVAFGWAGPPLELQDLTVRFGGLRALEGVSLVVPPRSVVGLIGPNGAGKTTLFDCVTGMLTPAHGRVLLFGTDVRGWPPHRRARLGVGRTFQRLELFGSLTVKEHLVVAIESDTRRGGLFSDLLALPDTVETRAEAEELATSVLDQVGLAELSDVPAGDLPVGLARMAELARALALFPKLLLLDEPNSGLSETESRRLAELVRHSRDERGRSVLLVEHDMAFVLGLCDLVYVLDFGRLIASGTPEEISRHPAVVAAYLGQDVDGNEEMADATA
jgi:ABC-type branched-subunit amino acid transport system ATPase component